MQKLEETKRQERLETSSRKFREQGKIQARWAQ